MKMAMNMKVVRISRKDILGHIISIVKLNFQRITLEYEKKHEQREQRQKFVI